MRFILCLLLGLVSLGVLATPVAEELVSGWFRKDVELRSELIFHSVEDELSERLATDSGKEAALKKRFNQLASDERVLGTGLCALNGKFLLKSSLWPKNVECPQVEKDAPEYSVLKTEKNAVLIGSYPVNVAGNQKARFVVLHDLTFSVRRTDAVKLYLVLFLISFSLIASVITILTTRLTLRTWLGRFRLYLNEPDSRSSRKLPREFWPIVREVRQMLREMRADKYQLENIKVSWSPQTLKRLLEKELPGAELIVVSNREPYIHEQSDDKIVVKRPASGLVTALEPIIKACNGTWVAHGSGSADKSVVDEKDCIAVPPEKPEYTLRRIWLTQEDEDGYYYGLANEGLWPLCHIAFVRPTFRESDWQAYKDVNRKFADAIVEQAKSKNPVVLVQDYHFALLPLYIRERLPDATILTFWHIPWPNPEVFSICPWREEILRGLLGSSILGFHTQFHCQNFLDTVERFLESHIDREQPMITIEGQSTLVRPYPISIAWPPAGLSEVPNSADCRAEILKQYDLPENALIGVGVERFDYTKGLLDRFQAIRYLLQNHPEWRGKFTFIQAAAPTRSRLAAYKDIQHDALELAEEINKEFGTGSYKPIVLIIQHHEFDEVFRLFRAADVCVVSSLHDGMNLVAKEFVASRENETGVLILSSFAGASKELPEALLVNPYDNKGMADAINRALLMPKPEQKERMRLMREIVSDNNVFYWAARILFDAARIRKRKHIETLVDRTYSENLSPSVINLPGDRSDRAADDISEKKSLNPLQNLIGWPSKRKEK
ncbi:MAG: trehalose-6-phosphate synthase [Alphaproteobacteria bacterium]|nr:trehalose-6-phosphate synthase [Alphaproteobacteria bacterium]